MATITAASGTGSKTMADMVALAAEKFAGKPALKHKVGGEWVDVLLRRPRRRGAARPGSG